MSPKENVSLSALVYNRQIPFQAGNFSGTLSLTGFPRKRKLLCSFADYLSSCPELG